jgi:hypothetical protein
VQTAKKFTFQPELQSTFTQIASKWLLTPKNSPKTVLQHQQPKSYAAALGKPRSLYMDNSSNNKPKFTVTSTKHLIL